MPVGAYLQNKCLGVDVLGRVARTLALPVCVAHCVAQIVSQLTVSVYTHANNIQWCLFPHGFVNTLDKTSESVPLLSEEFCLSVVLIFIPLKSHLPSLFYPMSVPIL